MHINLFQIARDGVATLSAISEDAGWVVLRSLSGGDSHQTDYDIIRHYFKHHPVEEDALYGFLLPSFFEETHLSVAAIHDFIAQYPNQDAYVFPAPVESAVCYWNVFEQGDTILPGLKSTVQTWLNQLNLNVSLDTLPMPLNRTVYQYYAIAKPNVWRHWLTLSEQLMVLARDANHPLFAALNTQATSRFQSVPMYQLIIERLLSLVLAVDQSLRVTHYDVYAFPCLDKTFLPYMTYVSSLDTLKRAYQVSRQQKHYDNFMSIRKTIFDRHLNKKAALAQGTSAIPFVCLTDAPLKMSYPAFIKPLYMGDAHKDSEGGLHIRDLAPEWEKWYPALGEIVGMIAYKNYIVKYFPSATKIGLCQPQKFVAKARFNQALDPKHLYQQEVIAPNALTVETLRDVMLPDNTDLLICEPVTLSTRQGKQSYLQHFGQAYCVEDLLRFAAVAVDFGVLDRSEQQDFLHEKWFYSGGCRVGVFPAEFWIQTVSAIENLIRKCMLQLPASSSVYQRSAWTLCAEHLMSYLLNKYVMTYYPDDQARAACFGQCILVSDIVSNPLSVPSL